MVLGTALAADETSALERVAEVRALSRVEAQKGLPVAVTGVVTLRTGRDSFYLDDGEGIHVRASEEAGLPKDYKLGDVVEVTGVTMAGSFAPSISMRTLKIVGSRPLPAPEEVSVADLMSGKYSGQRVAVRGIVQRITTEQKVDAPTQEMDVATEGGHVLASLTSSAVLDAAAWVDAEVRVVGVNQGILNSRGELIGVRIRSNLKEDFTMLTPPPGGPWDGPLLEADRLQPFSPQGFSPNRVRVAGVVTLSVQGEFLYLERNGRGVRVYTPQQDTFAPGDLIEAAGFAEGGEHYVELKNAVCRRTGTTTPPSPVEIDPEQIYITKKRSAGQDATDFDGRLVSIRGVIEGTDPTAEEGTRVTFRSGRRMVRAVIAPGEGAQSVSQLVNGSEVRITGICVMEFSNSPVRPALATPYVRRFLLNMRTAADVEVLALPSWWTPKRLGSALAAVAVILLGTLAWIVSLQRLLQQRTKRFEKMMQMHRNVELEFKSAQNERLRLAGDLHDGLQQMIAGAAYRVEAAEARLKEATPEVREQFTAARQALVRTQKQLRECVWGLREIEEDTDDFAALLQHAVSSVEHWPQGAVEVRHEGERFPLSRYSMGSLLMLMQEAVGNAFKHGQASRVTITLIYRSEELEMIICDDGRGFAKGDLRGTRQGHFGLESIQQRMKWLGGSAEITSLPGKGVSIMCRIFKAQCAAHEPQNHLNGG
jgi:signal transduction histidine kinase